MQNTSTTTGQPVRVVSEAAPLSDPDLARLGIDEVPDGQSRRWLMIRMRQALLMAASALNKYARYKRSAAAADIARATEAAANALISQ